MFELAIIFTILNFTTSRLILYQNQIIKQLKSRFISKINTLFNWHPRYLYLTISSETPNWYVRKVPIPTCVSYKICFFYWYICKLHLYSNFYYLFRCTLIKYIFIIIHYSIIFDFMLDISCVFVAHIYVTQIQPGGNSLTHMAQYINFWQFKSIHGQHGHHKIFYLREYTICGCSSWLRTSKELASIFVQISVPILSQLDEEDLINTWLLI